MKIKILLLPAIFMLFCSAYAQDKPFHIEGTVSGNKSRFIYLNYRKTDEKLILDSASITDGKFIFHGMIDGVTEGFLMSEKQPQNVDQYISLLLTPGNQQLVIKDEEFSKGVLSGTAVAQEYQLLSKLMEAPMAEYAQLKKKYDLANANYLLAVREKADEEKISSLKKVLSDSKNAMAPVQAKFAQINVDYMDKYPNGYVTAQILKNYGRQFSATEASERYGKLSPEVANSRMGLSIKRNIDKMKGGSVGASAPKFTSMELNGQQLSLTDYKGRYVLLDFWASWCVPCRKGNPHLLSLYSKYKSKGIEIIGVADDDGKPAVWKNAIDQDKIGVWKHIMRGLKKAPNGDYDRSNSISDAYAVQSLPTKVLIDPQGIIIGRYGGGGESNEALDKKLAELFIK